MSKKEFPSFYEERVELSRADRDKSFLVWHFFFLCAPRTGRANFLCIVLPIFLCSPRRVNPKGSYSLSYCADNWAALT